MVKNKLIYISLGMIFAIIVIFLGSKITGEKNYLSIENTSSEIITDVKVEYANGNQSFLGILYPRSEYRLKLLDAANESAVSVLYTDKNNKPQKELVIGYLELTQKKNYQFKIR